MSLREDIKKLVDEWVLSLADQYDNASERLKQTMEENPASDEDWDALLNPIEQLITSKVVSELEALVNKHPHWVDGHCYYEANLKQRINTLKKQGG